MIKKITQLFMLAALFGAFSLHAQVTTSGNSILVDGKRYTMRGVCYSPRAIGAQWFDYPDLGFPSYDKFAQDIRLMNEACINTIRTYYPIFDKTRLDQLNDAGIKVIITFPYQDGRGNVNASDRYEMLNGTYKNYINTFKNHPAILMWSFGNENNYTMDNGTWYAALETAAQWVNANDPNHPATTANGEVPTANMMTNLCPSVDVWGANVYRDAVANTAIGDYVDRGGTKPFWFSEIGVDSYNHNKGSVDEDAQAFGVTRMWNDIQFSIDNNGVCSGATYFNWTDEWWKSGSPSQHNIAGNAPAGSFYPDGVTDEEYYGILNQDRTPKKGYTALKDLWKTTCKKASNADFTLEDFECNRHLFYTNFDGGFTIVENPSSNNINDSEFCVKYERAPVQFAALVARTPQLEDASDFRNNTRVPTIDVYSAEPGTVLTLNLESSADITSTYPDGRFAVYTATTTKTNEWETLVFELQNIRDESVNPNDVDQIALLFNAGDASDEGTYYFDNLNGPEVIEFVEIQTSGITRPTSATACVADEKVITVDIKNNGTTAINFNESPTQVDVFLSGPKIITYTKFIETGTLGAGQTMEVEVTNEADFETAGTYTLFSQINTIGDNNCSNNKSATIQVESDICLGLNNKYENAAFQLYPNPGASQFTIKIEDKLIKHIDILNAQGVLIERIPVQAETSTRLSLPNLNNGVYIIKAVANQTQYIQKLRVIK